MINFYIGIDIGDGESAVAVLSEEAVSPSMVSLGYKSPSILSAVGFDKDGKTVIGENVAFAPNITGATVRFKSRFLTDVSAKTDLLHFAQGLNEALHTYGAELMSDQYVRRMIVGCPTGTGWTDEKRADYAGLIRQALHVCEKPVGESRAAFLHTLYSGDANIPRELLDENVLVIDMGSSTTDLAYIVKGREQQADVFGAAHLGGGLLDRALLDACVAEAKDCEQIRSYFARVPSALHRCEVAARRIKEGYFTDQANGQFFQKQSIMTLFCGKTKAQSTQLRLTVDDSRMKKLLHTPLEELGNRSYLESLQELLKKACEITKANPPDLVIMTGGASKMPFVQVEVSQMFPKACCVCSSAPEESIARGLAFACRVDARMEDFRCRIDEYTKSTQYENQLDQALPELVKVLAEALSPVFVEWLFSKDIQQVWHGAATQPIGAEQLLHQSFFADPKVRVAFETALKHWVEHDLTAMAEEISRICKRYKVSEPQLPLPRAENLKMKLPDFKLSPMIRMLGNIPFLKDLVRQRYVLRANQAMNQLMSKRAGTFYLTLRGELKESLKADIDQRARNVEIPIV